MIDPGWLDFKNDAAQLRDAVRREHWNKASWYEKILIWLNGDSPNGANHKKDWK